MIRIIAEPRSIDPKHRPARRLPGETSRKAGTFVSRVKVLRESGTARKRIYEVVVIEAGESLNRRFYPEETLRSAIKLFDGKAVHAFRFNEKDLNHLPESLRDLAPLGGALGNKVGTLRKPRWCPERLAIIAELHVPVNDSTKWFIDMADSSLELGEPQFGFSIDGQGEAFPKSVRGRVVEWVNRLTDIFSLDAVSNPAAGGRLLAQATVENVVGDPSKRLLRYEMKSRKQEQKRRFDDGTNPKRSPLRFRTRSQEGVSMKFRRNRPNDGERWVRKLIRALSGERHPRAKSVKRELRMAESLGNQGQTPELNIDRLTRQLESIREPSRGVRSAISQLRSLRAMATRRRGLHEQELDPEISPELVIDPPQPEEPVDLVEELMKLLEEEIDEPAREVFATLKRAKEFAEVGGSVELNIKDLLETLREIDEPTREVRQAIKLLKQELKRLEGEVGSADEELPVDSELDADLPHTPPSSTPAVTESFRRGGRRRRPIGAQAESELSQLRRELRRKEHQELVRTALAEAEQNGLPKVTSNELFRELSEATHLSDRAIRRRVNSRISEAQALMQSVKPDFSDIRVQPTHHGSKKSPIETTIFEAR